MKNRIILVEDDAFLRQELKEILSCAGYEVLLITTFRDTASTILSMEAELLLLDLGLPGQNGFEICRLVKQKKNLPILILTSADRLKDELNALELGADDYLTKPCHTERLLARIKNLLHRYAGPQMLSGNGFMLDEQTYTICVNNQSKVLPEKEGQIMVALLQHMGETVPKEDLFLALWGTKEYIDENALQVTMTRLRHTLKELGLKDRVETVRGIGYRLRRE